MASTKARVTLHQLAVAAGYGSLAKLADAAKVPHSVVYQANRGNVPSTEAIDAVVAALKKGPTQDGSVLRDDVLDAVALGAERKIAGLRRRR